MPKRDLYAAIDLGSNSFHMLVARREHGQLRIIDRIREMVRLAGGLDTQGNLDNLTRDRALECLARFGERIAHIPDHQIRAVGTQTFRRLRKPQRFLVPAETMLGCPIDIVEGREEARLVYIGVTHATPSSTGPRLVLDIGGGSTELVIGEGSEPRLSESIPHGCVAVTLSAFPKGRITTERWKRKKQEIAEDLQPMVTAFKAQGWNQAIGSSGTILAIQQIIAARDQALPRRIRPEDLSWLKKRLIETGKIEQIQLPGLSAHRAPVIAGGILVLHTVMRILAIDELEVSPFALREGLLFDLYGRLGQVDPRDRSVAATALRHEVDQAQAERVRDFALCGFEHIAEDFELREIHRDLLEWACALHEAGLVIAHDRYHEHSAYIVEHSDMAGFSRQEQQFIATLLRYQRGKMSPNAIDSLPERMHRAAKVCLALLRLAVALARSRADADMPDFSLHAGAPDQLQLGLPPNWLQSHPLSAFSLQQEVQRWRSLGLKLEICTLPEQVLVAS